MPRLKIPPDTHDLAAKPYPPDLECEGGLVLHGVKYRANGNVFPVDMGNVKNVDLI